MTALSEAVHELTRDHWEFITRDNGTRDRVTEEALLTELRAAIDGESAGTGEAATGGGVVPVSLAALDLWQEIATTTETHWPGHGRTTLHRTPLEEKIQAWAERGDTNLCEAWAVYWVGQIRGLRRRVMTVQAPCPMCGEQKITEADESGNGHQVRKDALWYTAGQDQCVAGCRACGASWTGLDEVKHLAGVIHRAI